MKAPLLILLLGILLTSSCVHAQESELVFDNTFYFERTDQLKYNAMLSDVPPDAAEKGIDAARAYMANTEFQEFMLVTFAGEAAEVSEAKLQEQVDRVEAKNEKVLRAEIIEINGQRWMMIKTFASDEKTSRITFQMKSGVGERTYSIVYSYTGDEAVETEMAKLLLSSPRIREDGEGEDFYE